MLAKCTDLELIEIVRGGELSAYGELWERHRRPGYVASRSYSDMDPEEAVSEAFSRILALIREGKGPSESFRPYLYTVIRTVNKEYLRTRSDLPLEDAPVNLLPMYVESAFTTQHDQSSVLTAFKHIPEKFHEVLWLVEVEGLTPKEVARKKNIPAPQVSTIRLRGRQALRRAWVDQQVDGARYWAPGCLEHRELLKSSLTGKLRSRQQQLLDVHLEQCEECANVAEEVRPLATLVGMNTLLLAVGLGAGLTAAQRFITPVAASAADDTDASAVADIDVSAAVLPEPAITAEADWLTVGSIPGADAPAALNLGGASQLGAPVGAAAQTMFTSQVVVGLAASLLAFSAVGIGVVESLALNQQAAGSSSFMEPADTEHLGEAASPESSLEVNGAGESGVESDAAPASSGVGNQPQQNGDGAKPRSSNQEREGTSLESARNNPGAGSGSTDVGLTPTTPPAPNPAPAPTPSTPAPTTPPEQVAPVPAVTPTLAGACVIVNADASKMKISGQLTSEGVIQFASNPGNLSNFVEVQASGADNRWTTPEVPLTGSSVSYRAAAPGGQFGSWTSVQMHRC